MSPGLIIFDKVVMVVVVVAQCYRESLSPADQTEMCDWPVYDYCYGNG